jgi:hypothetical protein
MVPRSLPFVVLRKDPNMRIARLLTVGFACLGIAWGCGSSSDTDETGGALEAGAGATAASGGSSGAGATGPATGGSGGSGIPDASAGSGGSAADGPGDAGEDAPAPNVPFECEPFGAACTDGEACCSKLCDPISGTCMPGECTTAGGNCTTGNDCCTFRCEGGSCSASQCVDDNAECSSDGECCSEMCSDGTCAPLNLTCRTSGNSCTGDSQCCSKYCNGGTCDIAPSWCVQTGDICTRGESCCSGRCSIADGASAGTCAPVWASGTNCSNKLTDGEVCGGFTDCGSCCSKLCAPNATTGAYICQPATGCRPEGSVCQEDRDCCGVSGTGLPGDGNTNCRKAEGSTLGVCKRTSCAPQGDICHFKEYVCGHSTASNNCCSATGSSGRCQLDSEGVLRCNGFVECPAGSSEGSSCSLCMLDAIGIPRCNGLGECRQEGETCSSALDCCDDLPCVVAPDGMLRCYRPPTDVCIPSGGSCTADADCCPGYTCLREPGSVAGVCGVVGPPPEDGGPVTPPGDCAGYGQNCSQTSDCCNPDQVPCTDGVCKFNPN